MERATASIRTAQELGMLHYRFIRMDPRFERAWQHTGFAAVMDDTRRRIEAMRDSIASAAGP